MHSSFSPIVHATQDDSRLSKNDLALRFAYLRHIYANSPVCFPGEERLCKLARLGRDAYQQAKRNLLRYGWITQTERRDKNGRFAGWLVTVHFVPMNPDQTGGTAAPITADGFSGSEEEPFSSEEKTHSTSSTTPQVIYLPAPPAQCVFPEESPEKNVLGIACSRFNGTGQGDFLPPISKKRPTRPSPTPTPSRREQLELQRRLDRDSTAAPAVYVVRRIAQEASQVSASPALERIGKETSPTVPVETIAQIERQRAEGIAAGTIRNPVVYRKYLMGLAARGEYVPPPSPQAQAAKLNTTREYIETIDRARRECVQEDCADLFAEARKDPRLRRLFI